MKKIRMTLLFFTMLLAACSDEVKPQLAEIMSNHFLRKIEPSDIKYKSVDTVYLVKRKTSVNWEMVCPQKKLIADGTFLINFSTDNEVKDVLPLITQIKRSHYNSYMLTKLNEAETEAILMQPNGAYWKTIIYKQEGAEFKEVRTTKIW